MDQVIEDISKLRLEFLSDRWVDVAFLLEFTEFESIPEEYNKETDSVNVKTVFEELLTSIAKVDSEVITWAQLSEEIPIRNLLAVIGHHLKLGVDDVVDLDHRNNALLAARVYFRLLMIPGTSGYNVYHSTLFAQSLSCLGFPKLMCDKQNQFQNIPNLTAQVNDLLKLLLGYVIDLKGTILKLRLKLNDINFEDILSNLLDVTGGSITQTLENVDKIVFSQVLGMIYHVITCMLCDYGDQPNSKAIELLFKCMLPKLIAVCGDNKAQSNIVRASYVTYSGFIVTSFTTAAIRPYTTLLEHLCYSSIETLERAEPRLVRSGLVVGLMSLLSDTRHHEFVKWLLVLSTTAKHQHRSLAVEIFSRLLNNEPEINQQRAAIWREIEKQRVLAGTLRHVTADHAYVRPVPKEDHEDSESTRNPASSCGPKQDVEEVEKEQLEDGDEEMGILRQQAHTVPTASILGALYECAQDSSSHVRGRALAVLCDSVASERDHMRRALEELDASGTDGTRGLAGLAARAVCDERAVVRRTAVTLMMCMLRARSCALVPEDFTVLVQLCCDAMVSVRMAVINAIVQLLTESPCAVTVDAFLAGPMQRFSDSEDKVSNLVKSHVENLLIARLVKHVPGSTTEDMLPWLLLEGFIRNKMKRILEEACIALAEQKGNKCISVRLVDILSTHLGVSAERDLQCVVLLTCLAPKVDYSNLGFVLDKYYEVVRDPDPRHSRLQLQMLELLSAWSKFMKAPDRSALRAFLIARLATVDDECRIASIFLATHLDRSNLTWATQLMLRSEKRAIEEGNLEEAMRAADVTVSAPVRPSRSLLRYFLYIVRQPPPGLSEEMYGRAVVALGRICVRWRVASRSVAPVLTEVLLNPAASLQARQNSIMVLSDISMSFTSIVEKLFGQICKALRPSEPPPLRHVASKCITSLLLNGFLRLSDPVYYTYVALLADADPAVREPVEYYVVSVLKVEVISNCFVESVKRYSKTNQEDGISLDFEARQLVYDLMLQRLSVVQKMNVMVRLAKEVLQQAADLVNQEEEIPQDLQNAVLDTIRILTGPRMRLPKKPQQTGEETNIEELQERVTNNIVSHKMKQTVADILVPAVLSLHTRLAPQGGQLAAYLVLLAQHLLQDYQQEIEELLESNEELVERMALFREQFSMEQGAGNARNLVVASGPPEPQTPRPARRRAVRRSPLKKRRLHI